jgi:hypothetical protein
VTTRRSRRSRCAALIAVVTIALTGCGTTAPLVTTVTRQGTGPAVGGGADSAALAPDGTVTGPATGAVAPVGGTSAGAAPGAGGAARTGGATGASPAAGGAAPGAATAAIPVKGRGWDKDFVYIGLTTQKDVQAVADGAGAKGLDGGDQEAQALAVAAELNRRGGVLGRKIKLVFRDLGTVSMAQDPNTAGAETCTYFTQDNPVVALISPLTLLDVPSFRACMAKAKVPLFSASVAAVDKQVSLALAPYFYQSVAPAWDALAPVLAQRLDAMGWFGGWNAQTGAANPAGKAKVGVLVPSDDVGKRIGATIAKALAASGHPDTVQFQYATATDLSPAVLQFAGNGVTHVIVANPDLLPFQLSANSQGYRPRYGISTYNAPQAFLESNSPEGQNNGAMGVGWSPSLDVADPRDPGPTGAGERECLQMLAKGGQTFAGKRLAEAVAFAVCDGMRLVVDGATASGSFLGQQLFDGIQRTASTFSPAISFASALGPGRLWVPGAGRDLVWDTPCRCVRYPSTTSYGLAT